MEDADDIPSNRRRRRRRSSRRKRSDPTKRAGSHPPQSEIRDIADDGVCSRSSFHLPETGDHLVHPTQLRPDRRQERPVRRRERCLLPTLAVRCDGVHGGLHCPPLPRPSHRSRAVDGGPDLARSILPGDLSTSAVSNLLAVDPTSSETG